MKFREALPISIFSILAACSTVEAQSSDGPGLTYPFSFFVSLLPFLLCYFWVRRRSKRLILAWLSIWINILTMVAIWIATPTDSAFFSRGWIVIAPAIVGPLVCWFVLRKWSWTKRPN